MKINFYGSCQLQAINDMITWNKDDQTRVFTNWKYIQKKDPLPENLFDCDIFIYQVYTPKTEELLQYNTDNLIKKLPKNTKCISIPFMQFGGYHPDIVPQKPNTFKSKEYPYGRFPQHSSVLNGNESEDYICSVALEKCLSDLEKVKAREIDTDIKVYQYILENYKTKFLFYSVQHPSNCVLQLVCKQICEILGIKFINKAKIELLLDHSVLILDSVYTALNLEFYNYKYKLYGNGFVSSLVYRERYSQDFNQTLQEHHFRQS